MKQILKNKFIIFIWQIFILGLIFGISYTQYPLYTSNQHTKFLQGLAKAGNGYLNKDWLANTLDPLPAFTFLVSEKSVLLTCSLFSFFSPLLLLFICCPTINEKNTPSAASNSIS